MTTPETRSEFAQPILERHESGASEADIRSAVRDFLIQTGLARESEIQQEEAPAPGESGRVDLRTRDVIFEFKRSIGNGIEPDAGYVQQLDDYLSRATAGGQPQRFGVLTDGKYWVLRWPGMGEVSTSGSHAFTLANAELGVRLYDWLRDQSQALEARGAQLTEKEVRQRLGEGPRFEQHIASLTELYLAHRDDPTIALKRDLWRSLLAAALGQVVEEEPDLDRLFVRHTYLSVVVGLAVQAAFGIEVEAAADSDPMALLGGQLFVDRTGVSGVVESDFFSWPAEAGPAVEGGDDWIRGVARRIGWFDWNEVESDIARVLYESVIPADDRRRLGEYYTPDWLARELVDAVVTDPLNQRVLDPACGSGSFIFAAVRKYLAAAKADGRSSAQAVDGLLEHVMGIDVHPVAVHLARATWTLAARDALEGAVAEGQAVSATVPVYLGDSLQLRAETSGMFAQQTVTIPVPDPPDSGLEFNRELEFPRALVEQADWFDSLMTRMASAIENGEDPAWALDDESIGSGSDREMLERTAALLKQLHEEGRDHIWAYYTRNLVRPVALRANPVDVIVGNPPWITYNKTQAVLREELERQSKDRYLIWAGAQYASTQDVAGLFFARTAELYLRLGGHAGMVLPHSALQAGQYAKWRSGSWGVMSVDLAIRPAWDLEKIEPNDFFPVPASVVFLQRKDSTGRPLASGADRWRGPNGGPFARESIELTDTARAYQSPYGKVVREGATIYPRALFFVNTGAARASVRAADVSFVSPRRGAFDRPPWRDLELSELENRPIEAQHIWNVLMGESIAPYIVLDTLQAVLPLSLRSGEIAKDTDGWFGVDPLTLAERMRRRWRVINEIWDVQKGPSKQLSLLENLDYMGKLSGQLPRSSGAPYRVAYSAGGRPTASVVDSPDVIIDCSLYWMGVQTRSEGDYVVAVINSTELEVAVAPLMSKGQFGARNMKKHLWRLPIPEFDGGDDLHLAIAEAGAEAAEGARVLWDEVRAEREGLGRSVSVTVARREIRRWLSESEEGRRVEELVGLVLGRG